MIWYNSAFTAKDVESVLKLATDYDIKRLLEECDLMFYEKLKPSTRDEDFVEYISMSQRYGLSTAKEMAIEHLAHLSMDELERLDHSTGVAVSTMPDILKRRLKLFENGSLTTGNVTVTVSGTMSILFLPLAASSTYGYSLRFLCPSVRLSIHPEQHYRSNS